jgi:hypothetical protein
MDQGGQRGKHTGEQRMKFLWNELRSWLGTLAAFSLSKYGPVIPSPREARSPAAQAALPG